MEVSFTGSAISSEGVLLLLKECEQQAGILHAIAYSLNDECHQSFNEHSYEPLLTQYVFQVWESCEDANVCNTIRNDKIDKLSSNRLPQEGVLASQPTINRFENKPSLSEQYCIPPLADLLTSS